ncbi:hypothetical protein M3589_03030 [Heyndrickxia oleronia]|uniref:hypothetical protein n=1 Tax=Heyndrickxia oleronia TaxID=38875 RepID=UPI00203FDB58|nr:hypothetical protein [Heyndrickxia oleronia]MCM3236694.1 hypothetical protein [Heyndrickxia oleronia]
MTGKRFNKKLSIVVILLFILLTMAFLDHKTEVDALKVPVSIATMGNDQENQSTKLNEPFDLEFKLVDTKEDKDEGEIVETYQEFEVYKDENGVVTKEVPTNHYNYLTYSTDNGKSDQ